MQKGNQYWNGSNSKLWINDKAYAQVSSFEVKLTMGYEEIEDGMKTVKVATGYKISGTIKLRKIGGEVKELLTQDLLDGIIPDMRLVGKTMNPATGKKERIAYTGVTLNEFDLNSFENKKVAELEFPFDAEDFERLD